MKEVSTTRVEGRRSRSWYWAFTGLLLFSLVVSLATRVSVDAPIQHATTAKSGTQQAMRQHMDRDAARWTAPVLQFTVLQVPTFYPRVVPAGPPVPTLLLEENLYNRPPPTC
jgi:uncharacterized membrane protein YhaH (DUF805 family)